MATRTDLRAFLKHSQKTSEIAADARSPSYLKYSPAQTNEIPVRGRKEACVNNNDELVKYMSKLPGYLQGDESVQSNALNVGVLDWSRLEKWKHGRAGGACDRSGKCEKRVSSTSLGALPNASHHRCSLEPELASSWDSLNKQEMPTCSYKSFARDQERVKNPVKSRRSPSFREPAPGLLSTTGNSGGSLGAKLNLVVQDKDTEKRSGEVHAQEARESGKQCVDGEEKTIRGLNAAFTSEKHQVSNIVLLRSRRKQSPSTSTLSGQPHMSSLDATVKVTREVNRSLDFSSLELTSQNPRSCPLSLDSERDSEDMMLPLLGADLSSRKERFGGTRRHSKTASKIFDQEIQQEKNIDPSPSKRFSFSFGRLSRSFTFKEDSSACQPLSSSEDTIKSDSATFDGSACPSQSSYLEKQNTTQCGSRVSPRRRLLLRPKGSEDVPPSKARSSSPYPKPANMDVPLQDAPRTRALLQLTIRNGIPMFQFVVDEIDSKSRSILGATMKSPASTFKDDTAQYGTFYSVNEVKKKKSGSWLMLHGHKEKQHRFVYNVIGQMQLCNSMISEITEKESENMSSVMRESVLFEESEKVKGRKEVAAVVIKKKLVEENFTPLGETTVIIPGGVHSIPEEGAPTPLIIRWRSGGCCDCGGWDVGCKLHVLSNKTVLHELDQGFKLIHQDQLQEESDKNSGAVLAMTELKRGIYRVEYGSFLSHLQAFFVCVTVITCVFEEETGSKTTGKSSSPFAPPLSPVGRA